MHYQSSKRHHKGIISLQKGTFPTVQSINRDLNRYLQVKKKILQQWVKASKENLPLRSCRAYCEARFCVCVSAWQLTARAAHYYRESKASPLSYRISRMILEIQRIVFSAFLQIQKSISMDSVWQSKKTIDRPNFRVTVGVTDLKMNIQEPILKRYLTHYLKRYLMRHLTNHRLANQSLWTL